MRLPNEKDTEVIEQLADQIGMEELSNILAAICAMKAEHIAYNWGGSENKELIETWNQLGIGFSQLADDYAANL